MAAIRPASRLDRIYTSPSAASAADLLRQISNDVDIEQIQVDGGSKFHGTFETACKEIGLRLFVLPPISHKLNGHIESVNAMIVRKLLNFKGIYDDLEKNRRNLKRFISDYREVRPHKALGLETPNDWIKLTARGNHPILRCGDLRHFTSEVQC